MECREKGTKKGSHYYFFQPAEFFKSYYYYVSVIGHLYSALGYEIHREDNESVAPLLIYIIQGELSLDIDGKTYVAQKGEAMLIHCHHKHHYYCNKSCEFMFFHFQGNNALAITEHLIKQNDGPIFRFDDHQKIYDLINDCYSRLLYDQTLTDTELSSMVYQSLCLLQSMTDLLPQSYTAVTQTINDSIQYMKKNIGEDLSLSALAKEANLSTNHYAHKFKKETGYAPATYVAILRNNIAKVMLRTTRKAVNEIAQDLGYSSSASFINAFTSRNGLSPLRFRQHFY